VISGNIGDGIALLGLAAQGNVVQGNYIGLNVSGSAPLPNSGAGIHMLRTGANTIGGQTGEGNVISGNGAAGISIRLAESVNNVIQGNFIGTESSGKFPIPNQGPGLLISESARNNLVGGTDPGSANVLAFNKGDGVLVQDAGTTGNTVIGNSIHSNGRLGIDLGADGVTPNDVGDGDTGPNRLQNYPVITNVVYLSNNTIVQGYLRSSTNGSFSIDVYANGATEQSGYGEGQFYLGNVDVDTDENGFTQFAFSAGNAFSNQFFTATALNYDTGDTSEFSAAMGGIRITSVQRVGNQYHVSFSTRTNHTYVPEFTTNLNSSTGWTPVVVPPQPIQGTGGVITVADLFAGMDRMRIYRVREQP
jgi:hypothetical protein